MEHSADEEKAVPMVFAQSGCNDELCSLMSSVLQRNVFVDRSPRFLRACHESFEMTLRALTTWKSGNIEQMILMIRNDAEFPTQVAGQVRGILSKVGGSFVDLSLGQSSNERQQHQITEVIQAVNKRRSVYVVVVQLDPVVWLRPVASASRIAGVAVLFPPEYLMLSIADSFDKATGVSPVTLFVTQVSSGAVKKATSIQQTFPNTICVLLPLADDKAVPTVPAFLARAILLFVVSHHNVTHPTLVPRL